MPGVIAALGGGAGIAAILVAFASVIGQMRHNRDPNAHGGSNGNVSGAGSGDQPGSPEQDKEQAGAVSAES